MPQYQGVWTLQAQAQAQSNQQWVTDPQFKNTTLLLQADGTGSGSQNQTFLDGSTNNFFITRNGNTTQGSFTPFSQAPGYWGNYFDGSSYLTTANNANLNLGSSNFTIEFWIYAPSATNPNGIISKGNASSIGSESWSIEWTNTTGTLGFGSGAFNGWSSPIVTGTVTLNAWNHVAVVRNGTTHTFYINGTSASTATASYTVTSAGALYIGTGWYAPGSRYSVGYISNARIVIGTAVYTSNFTPSTTPLTAITNTQLLTCQSNRFIDNSSNAFTITTSGTPSVQAFAPFAPQYQYDATVTGGSGYFDGTGDYLTGPSASGGDFSTGSFTISCWFYPTTLTGGTNYGLMSYADTGGWNGWQLQVRGSTKDILFEFLTGSAGASQITGGSIALNAWNFVSIVRSGSTVSMYVNSTTAATSTTNSTAYGAATSRVIVGSDRTLASSFIGYISNSKLVKQANAPASIPTAPDTATTNTSLLLNYTNAGIYDGTLKNNLETVGDAQVSTSVVKYGSGSMKFDGTGDYLVAPSNAFYNFGTGDFTIECWARFGTVNAAKMIVSSNYNSSTGAGGWAFILRGDITSLSLSVNSNVVYSKSWSPSTNTWYHIAVCRSGTNLRFFVDGTQIGTTSTSSDNVTGASTLVVGGNLGGGANLTLDGYLDDLRITNYARYTANFTPPQQALPRQ